MLVHGLRLISHSLNEDVMLCYVMLGLCYNLSVSDVYEQLVRQPWKPINADITDIRQLQLKPWVQSTRYQRKNCTIFLQRLKRSS